MKSKLLAAVAALGMAALTSQAGVNVNWYVGYGVYPQGAADTTSTTAGTGLLANNGSGQTILQLIWAGADNAIDLVNPGNSGSGYVSDDDVVWASIPVTSGAGGYDEWVFNATPPTYVNATFTAGFVYIRVFQDETPVGGEYYQDSSLLGLNNVGGDATQSQVLQLGTESNGVSTETQIVPEPSAVMLAGLGALVLAIRRRRQA